jgi:RHS repeat-associated protein
VKITTYTIGHDVLAQANALHGALTLLADGHGSTRAMANGLGSVLQQYNYDAYGNALGFDAANALTNLLYSGEQFNPASGLQYLRARWYNPQTGTFNRLDPFAGNRQNPLSFHKYAYAHMNPIINTDPSGRFVWSVVVTIAVIAAIPLVAIYAPAMYFSLMRNPLPWVLSWEQSYQNTLNTLRDAGSHLPSRFDVPPGMMNREVWNDAALTVANNYADGVKWIRERYLGEGNSVNWFYTGWTGNLLSFWNLGCASFASYIEEFIGSVSIGGVLYFSSAYVDAIVHKWAEIRIGNTNNGWATTGWETGMPTIESKSTYPYTSIY